jgi:hypothetical protein
MNCSIDYYGDNSIDPVSNPTLAPSSAMITHGHKPVLDPSPEPTDIPIPMTHRLLRPNVSLQGCVETRSHGTRVPSPCHTLSRTPKKEVSWRDSLFPCHLAESISPKS